MSGTVRLPDSGETVTVRPVRPRAVLAAGLQTGGLSVDTRRRAAEPNRDRVHETAKAVLDEALPDRAVRWAPGEPAIGEDGSLNVPELPAEDVAALMEVALADG